MRKFKYNICSCERCRLVLDLDRADIALWTEKYRVQDNTQLALFIFSSIFSLLGTAKAVFPYFETVMSTCGKAEQTKQQMQNENDIALDEN